MIDEKLQRYCFVYVAWNLGADALREIHNRDYGSTQYVRRLEISC
jgi:hypothetical protein